MKTCTRCGSEKTIDNFHNDKNRTDGKYPQCKACVLHLAQIRRDSVSGGATAKFRSEKKRKEDLLAKGLKECTKCLKVLDLSDFHKAKSRSDGRYARCKSCALEDKKKDHLKHREQRIESLKAYREENKEKTKASQKHSYQKNRSHYVSKAAEWASNNPGRLLENKKRWLNENRDRINEKNRRRRREDPAYRAGLAMKNVLYKFLERSKGDKEGRTHEVLGYSYEEFKHHIEKQFTKGMGWHNHGEWHIDHIIPVSSYIKEGVVDPAVVNCLTNLRPMWAKDNISKSNKLTHLI